MPPRSARQVEFRLGELEYLPIADNTADVMISNCVINLVPDKAQVFREAFRVLKPGGRLAISDVVNIGRCRRNCAPTRRCCAAASPAPRPPRSKPGCGGRFHRRADPVKPESREPIAGWAPGRGIENYVASAIIEARKPRRRDGRD